MSRPVLQVILDGWAKNPLQEGNAVFHAKTPTLEFFLKNYPYAVIEASSMAVGLPWGEVGNSEVGHTNLGSGQVIYQNLPRISMAIETKELFSNQKLLDAIETAKKNKSKIHLMGVISNGGVHAHIEHLDALLLMMRENKFKDVYIHGILDGRDTDPKAGVIFLETLQETMKVTKIGSLASLIGRYYCMDRNNHWDRTQKAYDLMTKGVGEKTTNPIESVKAGYEKGLNDENMEALSITDKKGNPVALVEDGDVFIFFNFRPDRARQITKSFVLDEFTEFEREQKKDLHFVTMMEYEKSLPVNVVFPPQEIKNPIGKIISEAGKLQLRIAETEKYAHVTYFFNGGNEDPFANEDHILVPSPDVANYDEVPRMSSDKVTEKLLGAIDEKKYDYMLVNYANPDMIGHTGNFEAGVETIEATDEHLKKLYDKLVVEQGGIMVIIADHGNVEVMIDPVTGRINKEHTTNPVGLYIVDPERQKEKPGELWQMQSLDMTPIGILADIGPTVLELMGINPPSNITGRSLVNDCI